MLRVRVGVRVRVRVGAVAELHQVIAPRLRGLAAASHDQLGVDVDRRDVVHHDAHALALLVLQDVLQQRRLPRAQETG